MQLRTDITYREIFKISAPLMLGSAGQNLLVVVESAFLYYLSESDFAAIGFAGMFYLIIAAVGFGMSRGGQILIARRTGEGKPEEVGRTFVELLYLELVLALFMFLIMQFVAPWVFPMFIKSEVICQKTLTFLSYRSWGVFFSYLGLAMVTLYSGVARGKIIAFVTLLLGVANTLFCYLLIFGKFGFPEMGIGGAGLAATLAELLAFLLFAFYTIFDKETRKYHVFTPRKLDFNLLKLQFNLSLATTAQSLVSIGSWFLFFAMVEHFLEERDLATANLVRMLYLLFSIPTWGFSTGINTIVSNFIGQQKYDDVLPVIWKTAKLTLWVTVGLALPFVLFPMQLLYPLLKTSEHAHVFHDAVPILKVIIVNLAACSLGCVYFYGLAGTGATRFGLQLQVISTTLYLGYIYSSLAVFKGGLTMSWFAESVYWGSMLLTIIWYLKSNKWHTLEV